MKKHTGYRDDNVGSMKQAHQLTADYFTIHPQRERSRGSSVDRATVARSSHMSRMSAEADDLLDPEEIKDINALMKSLRKANVDREKINAVKKFVDHGGEELFYLEDKVRTLNLVIKC